MKHSATCARPRIAAALPWVGALAIAMAVPAAAQPTIRATLDANDEAFAGGRVSDEYPVRVRAGSRLTVTTIATPPLMTGVFMESPTDGVQTMEVGGNPVGDLFEWVYTRDITRDETVTVIVAGMAPVGERGGAGSYTIRIEAPGGGAAPAPVADDRPAPAASSGRDVPEVITRQLEGFLELVGRNGFRLVNPEPLAGALNGGTQEDLPLALTARQYIVVGVCDGDCTDMDLRLLDRQGNTVAQDVADDDTPLLVFTVQASGSHVLRVMMPACGADPCFYGVSVFAK